MRKVVRSEALVMWMAWVALGATASAQTAVAGDSTGKPSAHARMLALLEKTRVEAQATNPYLGSQVIDELRAALAKLPEDPNDPHRWQTNLQLGAELLRVGRTQEAIDAYEAAAKQVETLHDKLKRPDAAETAYLLGTAYLRLGENLNCCLKSNADSCILPIRGGGLHTDKHGSQSAVQWFTRALELSKTDSPRYVKARWLLNVAHMTLGTYPDGVPADYRVDPKVFASQEEFPRFVDVAPKVGLDSVDLAGGAAIEDFDGDGWLDVLVTSSDTGGSPRYFKNDGSGRFRERTEAANLVGLFGGLNIATADYDDDGDVDVLVLRGAWWKGDGRHPKSLLQNDGHGVFTDVTLDVGLGASLFPTQTAAFADYDNDGDLDLYIGNESDPSSPSPCELYRNDGAGKFENVAAAAGVTNERYTKAVSWGDYDDDRYPDLYVSNMAGLNRLYHNNRDGTFTDVAEKAGVGLPISCFPTWFFDYDNDGSLDIFVGGFGGAATPPSVADVAASYLGLPYQGEELRLYDGDGRGAFKDVTAAVGLKRCTLPMGSNFGDLDNDGYLDVYLGTGYPYFEGLIPNVMFHNRRGRGFSDVTTAGGFGVLQKGHGVSFADLDNDGDQDVFERVGGAYPGDGYRNVLFENPGFGAHWLKLRLIGERSNRYGVGARIRADIVENDVPRTLYKTVNTGGTFGCNPLRQELGLGAASKVARLEIYWPTSDTRQVFSDVEADQALEIREGSDELKRVPLERFKLGG